MRIAAGLVLLICLLPSLALLALAIGDPGYRSVLESERQVGLLCRTLRIAAEATLLALLLGGAAAIGLRALRGAAGALVEALSLLPLLLPSIVLVMGWVYLLGANGPVRRLLGAAPNLFTEAGAAFVLATCYAPCVSLLLVQGLRALDPASTMAARLHAGRLRTALHITLPLLAPYAATGALLVFLLSLGDYGVPSALGVNVYQVEIFSQMSAYYDLPRAVAFATPPVGIALVLAFARHLLLAASEPLIGGRTHALEGARSPLQGLLAAPQIAAGAILPVAMLVSTLRSAPSFAEALSVAGDQALNSLTASSLGTLLLLAAAAVIAAALKGLGRRASAAAQVLITLPLVLPGAAVGLGIVLLYAKGILPRAIYGGPGAVAYAMLCRTVTLPTLVLAAAFSAIRGCMADAAAVHGAGRLRTAARVTIPLALPGIVSAAALAFVFCLGELPASALVNPPGLMTLPVRIASLLHFGEDRIVAALCLTLSAFVAGTFTIGLLLAGNRLELTVHARRD